MWPVKLKNHSMTSETEISELKNSGLARSCRPALSSLASLKLALAMVGNKWNIIGCVCPFLCTSPVSPILCALLSFLPSGPQNPTAFWMNNYRLLNTMDSARCFKIVSIMIAILHGSERLNDFQGHKIKYSQSETLMEG